MAKVRITFEFDLQKIAPEANTADLEAAAKEVVERMLLNPVRQQANTRNVAIRKSDASYAEKQRLMAEELRVAMLTQSASANMQAEVLPEGHHINTLHPVEAAA